MHIEQQDGALRIVGIELRTSHREAVQSIPPHWQRFTEDSVLARIPGKLSDEVYAVFGHAFERSHVQLAALGLVEPASRWIAEYVDDPSAVPEHQLCSRAGLSVPDGVAAVPPLLAFEVGGGPCAVLRHRGPYATMRAAYQWLYGHWLVNSGHEVGDAPVFEEYLNNPRDTAPADLLTDICLPLARAHGN